MKSTQAMRDRIRELMTDPIDDYDRAVLCVLNELEHMLNEPQSLPKWRHLKRGSIVTEVARGFAQVAHHPIEEMTAVVIYKHDADGVFWVRNAVEFDDGRFEPYPLSRPMLGGDDAERI